METQHNSFRHLLPLLRRSSVNDINMGSHLTKNATLALFKSSTIAAITNSKRRAQIKHLFPKRVISRAQNCSGKENLKYSLTEVNLLTQKQMRPRPESINHAKIIKNRDLVRKPEQETFDSVVYDPQVDLMTNV